MRTIFFGYGRERTHPLWSTLTCRAEGTHLVRDRNPSLTRLSSVQERAERIGYAAFAILFAVLDIGCVIVRVAGLIALSGSPALAASLVLVSMSASITLPLLTYPARLLKRKKRESGGEVAMESGTVAGGAGTSES